MVPRDQGNSNTRHKADQLRATRPVSDDMVPREGEGQTDHIMVGVYVGLVVHKPLVYQRKYDLVLGEVMTYLSVHSEEVTVR